MKKYISLLLCLCVAVSFAAPAFAAGAEASVDLSAVLSSVTEVIATEEADMPAETATPEEAETSAVSVEESAPVVKTVVTVSGTDITEGAESDESDDSGWLFEDGVLTVFDNAAMIDHWPPWSAHQGEIKKVILKDGITAISAYAFHGCALLEEIVIPEGVTRIGQSAFKECVSLAEIKLPESLKTISYGAFANCIAFSSFSIPDGVTTIDDQAFSGCTALKSIKLPEGLERIERQTFYNCKALESIELPAELTLIDDKAFYNCTGLKTVSMGDAVATISTEAFANCAALEEIELSDALTWIEEKAFSGCAALNNITFPLALKTIGSLAFMDCLSLTDSYYGGLKTEWERLDGSRWVPGTVHCKELALPVSDTVTNALGQEFTWSIDADGVFTVSGEGELPDYESINKLKGDPILPPWIHYKDRITKVIVAEGITRIGDYSFQGFSGVLSVELSEGLREIGERAFSVCSALKTAELPDSLTTLGNYAFHGCALESVTVSSGLIDVGYNVFSRNLALTEVTVATAELGETCVNMFENCTGLTTVTVEEGVKKLPKNMFNGCTALKTVDLPSTLEEIGEHCFYGCSALMSVELPDGLKTIGGWAFRGCDLQSFDIPESVETVGDYAYGNNVDIASVTIPVGVTMGSGVFYECTGIKTATVEEGVTEVAAESFKGCSALKTVKLASTLESIGEGAFQNCPLTSIALPEGLKNLGGNVFYGCDLSSITLPDGLESIGKGAFAANERITKATIPGGVSKIETYIFRGCTGLKTVTLEEGVTFISGGAFSGCDYLTTLKLPSTIEIICWSFELPRLQNLTIAKDPEGKRSFVCWQDEEGYVYTTQDLVDGVEFNGQLRSVWKNIWLGYNDVSEDAWYIEYVKYCYEIGLMNGMGDGNFEPNGGATRGQVVTVLYRMAGEPEVAGGSSFTDVYEDDWYYDAIAWAASEGIAQGMGDGTFAPNDNVTREQFLVFLYRFVDYNGLILNDWETRYMLDSIDADSVSDWALDAQVWSLTMGLQTGYEETDGYSVKPQNWITRAEMATFLSRYMSNMVLYYNGEVAESLCDYMAEHVIDAFGNPEDVVEKNSSTQYWHYDDYGIAIEMRWDDTESVWYEYTWWWNY